MSLRGQGSTERGYAMAALLVAIAVMAIMMSVAIPKWGTQARRQREAELIWRGQQYMRAIRLYQMKFGTLPMSVDALVDGHFIRKKYKDPITNDEFEYLGAGSTQPGLQPGQGQGAPGRPGGAPVQPQTGIGTPGRNSQSPFSTTAASGGTVPGGLSGVRSKSKDESIKLYQGRNHYNEWTFIFVAQQPGGLNGPGGRGAPGGPGGRGLNPNGQPIPFGLPGQNRGGPPRGGPPPGSPGRGRL